MNSRYPDFRLQSSYMDAYTSVASLLTVWLKASKTIENFNQFFSTDNGIFRQVPLRWKQMGSEHAEQVRVNFNGTTILKPLDADRT